MRRRGEKEEAKAPLFFIKMGLSEMYQYYRKTVADDGQEMVDIIWKRGDWHRLFRDEPSEDSNDDNNKDNDDDKEDDEYNDE